MFFSNIKNYLIDMFFPSYCVCCMRPIGISNQGICSECFNGIEYITGSCEKCSGELVGGKCEICSSRKFYPEKNISVVKYSGPAEKLMQVYKFQGRRRIGKIAADIVYNKLMESDLNFDLISAVPMNPVKKWRRGFNQAELVARDIALRLKLEYRSLLRERAGSGVQSKLRMKDRFVNVLGRYSPTNLSALKNRRVLIIDDIFTTGATVNECARVLLDGGADAVYSLTITRV